MSVRRISSAFAVILLLGLPVNQAHAKQFNIPSPTITPTTLVFETVLGE